MSEEKSLLDIIKSEVKTSKTSKKSKVKKYEKTIEPIKYNREHIEVNVDDLHDFKNHPFKVEEDKDMEALKESIRSNGVMTPILVRQVKKQEQEQDVYEIISGHRRKFACKGLGIKTIPAELIRDCNDSQAIRMMVCSNLQRTRNKYSEMLKACTMMYNAMLEEALGQAKKQGGYDSNREEEITSEIQEKVVNIAGIRLKTLQSFIEVKELFYENPARLNSVLNFIDKGKIPRSFIDVVSKINDQEWIEITDFLSEDSKRHITSEQAKGIKKKYEENKEQQQVVSSDNTNEQ